MKPHIVLLHSSVGRASHQYRGGHVFESRWNLEFFRLLLSNCINWKIYCDDHSSLSYRNIVGRYMLRAFGHPVATCCDVLGVVGSSLKMAKFEPTTPNTSQHVATFSQGSVILSSGIHMFQVLSAKRVNGSTISGSVEHRAHLPRDIGLTTYITKIRPVLEYASPVWGGLPICLEEELHRVQNTCLNVIGLLGSLVTTRQNLTRKEFKRIPCRRFLEKPVDHGHNLRSCKTNPAHLRIPVSRTVRHKQSFIPRGAKLNLTWYVYILCSNLNFYCNITVIPIAKGNK